MSSTWRHVTPDGTFAGDEHEVTSRSGRFRHFISEARAHRQALRAFTSNRFRATYRAQSLGIVWPIANPLILTIVISIVFGLVFQADVRAYPVFLMLGLVLWHFLTHAWTDGTGSLIRHADLLKRAAVPAWVVIIGTVSSHLFTLGFASLSILPLVGVYPGAFHVSFALLLVPVHVALVVVMVVGLNLATAVLNVLFRDVSYIVDSFLLVLFWATPIMWPIHYAPEAFRPFLLLNPLASNLQCIRDVVLKGEMPPLTVLAAAVVGSLGVFILGSFAYYRFAPMVSDHV